jgi:ParB family transcriptional regulator, chromosome partitioning protein
MKLPIEIVEPNPDQPRKVFDAGLLGELKDSIARVGLLQPVAVIPKGDGKFAIVDGERRWRMCVDLGWTEIPATVLDDETYQQIKSGKLSVEELALIGNLQRKDLTAVEEGEAFEKIITAQKLTAKKLAQRLGKSEGYISDRRRLLRTPAPLRDLVLTGAISLSQARELSRVTEPKGRAALAQAAVGGATVRELHRALPGENGAAPLCRTSPEASTADAPASKRSTSGRATCGRRVRSDGESTPTQAVAAAAGASSLVTVAWQQVSSARKALSDAMRSSSEDTRAALGRAVGLLDEVLGLVS